MSWRTSVSPRVLPLVLLVCALFACLSGLARPAMAMSMDMPGMAMMSPHAAIGGDEADTRAEVAMFGESPGCPVAEEQCVAPKGTPAQDGPAVPIPGVVSDVAVCSPALLTAQPRAPPPAAAPPDLHRLCVSRT